MSTWHQQKNPVPLYHPTKWTAVFDPPDKTTTVQRFDTCEEANAATEGQPHTYVLPPSEAYRRQP